MQQDNAITNKFDKIHFALLFRFIVTHQNYFLVITAMIFSALVHSSILRNFFFYDDYLHLYDAANRGFIKFIILPHGGHLYLVRNVIFYAFYKLFGFHTEIYFISVLLTHMLNVLLLFNILKNFTDNSYIAFSGASLWGINPINQGTLAWYSAYGHALAGTFFLWILYDISRINCRRIEITKTTVVRWMIILFACATCFGTGIALATTFPIVAWLLLYNEEKRKTVTKAMIFIVIIISVIWFFLNHQYKGINLESLVVANTPQDNSINALFDPFSWGKIVIMLCELIAYSISSTLLGPFYTIINIDNFKPVCYFISFFFLFLVVWTYLKGSTKLRYRLLSFLVLLISIYGFISLGRAVYYFHLGHAIEKAILISPRWYYIGTMLVTIILCLLLERYPLRQLSKMKYIKILPFILLAIMIVPAIQIAYSSIIFRASQIQHLEYDMVLSEINRKIERQGAGQNVYIPNYRLKNIFVPSEFKNFPGAAALYIMSYPENIVNGRRVYFVEPDHDIVTNLRKQKSIRISGVLVKPDEIH